MVFPVFAFTIPLASGTAFRDSFSVCTSLEYDTLFEHRVFVSNYMSEIVPGSKPVLFGDFSYFWIGDRGKCNIKRLNEAYAKFGQVGFLLSERVDSKLVVKDAVKTLKVAE